MKFQVIVLSRGAVAFSGVPSAAEGYFASIGRPFPSHQPGSAGDGTAAAGDEKRGGGDGGDATGVAGGVNPTDAILDVIGEAEAGVDREIARGVGGARGVEGGVGLVVMSRELLVRQVGGGNGITGGRGRGGEASIDFPFCCCLGRVVFGSVNDTASLSPRTGEASAA